MITNEQEVKIAELTINGVNGWAKKLFCGPILLELINGQTDLIYLAMPDLSEDDRVEVRRIVREKVKEELVKVFVQLGK